MSEIPDIDALAEALGITLQPEWREGVRVNLEVSLRMAREVAAFPLEDEVEPAFTYRVDGAK